MAGAKQGRLFYGWWIVVAGCLAMVLNGCLYYYGFSAFFTPLIIEFGWSRAALSGAFSLARLEGGIVGPLAGYLTDRLGPRKLMLFGFLVMGLGYLLISRVQSLLMFYVVFVFALSLGASFGFSSSVYAALANWFVRRRSAALGIAMSGIGLGGIGLPALAWLIEVAGWRAAALAAGAVFLVLGIPIALVVRHRPEPYGYLPDGDSAPPATPASTARAGDELPSAQEGDFSAREALRTRSFWWLATAFSFRQLVTAGIAVHQIPFLIDNGFSPEGAATVLGLMTLLSISGRLGFGWLGDRYDKRYVIAACLGLQGVGLFFLISLQAWWYVIPFLLIYSPGYGGSIPVMPATWADYFGRRQFATIQGFSQAVQMWGTIVGPLLAGLLFDLSGSYRLAFTLFALANALGIVGVLTVRRPQRQAAVMVNA